MFNPQNSLENSLISAATDPSQQTQFYHELLKSEVLILPVGSVPPVVDGVIQSNTQLTLQRVEINGKSLLPFFSSISRVETLIQGERQCFVLGVRPFLELTKGTSLVLNPGSNYSKEFSPDDVARLLDGSIFHPIEQKSLTQTEKIFKGEPKQKLTKLVESLKSLYSKLPKVRAAYLSVYADSDNDKKLGLLVALDTTGDWKPIATQSEISTKGLFPGYTHINFVQLEQSEFRSHFEKLKPFYKKSFLKGLM